MSNKTAVKRSKRQRRKADPLGGLRPAYHFLARYRGMTPEQIEAAQKQETLDAVKKANLRLQRPAAPAPVVLPSSDAKGMHRTVTLVEGAEGSIQEGSLRAAVIAAIKAGRGSMTLEELSKELKRDARPIVAKLQQKGWLKTL